MSKNFVKGNFKNLQKLLKDLKTKKYVDVGILQAGSYPNGTSIAYVGATHEFGTSKAGRSRNVVIPERSFLRMPLNTQQEKIAKNIKKKSKGLDVNKVLDLLGQSAVAVILEAFETNGFGTWAPLSDSTIAKRGASAQILQDTALLKKSIDYKVGGR